MVVHGLDQRGWRVHRVASTAVQVLVEDEAHEKHIDGRLVDLLLDPCTVSYNESDVAQCSVKTTIAHR